MLLRPCEREKGKQKRLRAGGGEVRVTDRSRIFSLLAKLGTSCLDPIMHLLQTDSIQCKTVNGAILDSLTQT